MHCIKNTGDFFHGGVTATLVDLVGSAVIYTFGPPATAVSVEINVSYLDAASADISFYATLCFVVLKVFGFVFSHCGIN
jgi:acyl-coenzyme A thioesterase PaaI-like protein